MSKTSGQTLDVLVMSPRGSFLELLKDVLKGYYIYNLHQKKNAEELFDDSSSEISPAVAIIDGQDGTSKTVELAQTTKMTYPDCSLIVLHSAEAPLNFEDLKKQGVETVLHIQYDREFITDTILEMAPIEIIGEDIPITALMPVDLRDIEPGLDINFDVYVHLPANHRSVVLRRTGDILDERQIQKFKNLKQQMYIKKTQKDEFFTFARRVLSLRNSPLPMAMTEKFHRAKADVQKIMNQLLNSAATDYAEGKLIYEKCQGLIAEFDLLVDRSTDELQEEIYRYTNNTRSYYHDSICLAAYGAFFAQLLGWNAEKRQAAALSGLFHNIGLAQMPTSIGNRPVEEYTSSERSEYERYPERSVNLVKAKKVPLSQDISDGILQHRENTIGSGFPKKVAIEDLTPAGKLMAIAYHFMERTSLVEGRKTMSASEALHSLRDEVMSGETPLDLITISQLAKKVRS